VDVKFDSHQVTLKMEDQGNYFIIITLSAGADWFFGKGKEV
jgi:hypothetical protein